MKKPQKHSFPSYSSREYLNGLKHKVLSEDKLRPELVQAVGDTIYKSVEAECNLIRAKADARLNLITAKTGEKMLKENN